MEKFNIRVLDLAHDSNSITIYDATGVTGLFGILTHKNLKQCKTSGVRT